MVWERLMERTMLASMCPERRAVPVPEVRCSTEQAVTSGSDTAKDITNAQAVAVTLAANQAGSMATTSWGEWGAMVFQT